MASRPRGAPPKYSPALIRKIARLRDRELSWSEIGRRLKVPRETARRLADETPRPYLEEQVIKLAKRCPGCRRKVVLPCLACEVEKLV